PADRVSRENACSSRPDSREVNRGVIIARSASESDPWPDPDAGPRTNPPARQDEPISPASGTRSPYGSNPSIRRDGPTSGPWSATGHYTISLLPAICDLCE